MLSPKAACATRPPATRLHPARCPAGPAAPAGERRRFRVRLLLREGSLRVEVSDARVDRLPVPGREADEGGRGLLLGEAPAEKWGVEIRPGGAYKTVWAELRVGSCTD